MSIKMGTTGLYQGKKGKVLWVHQNNLCEFSELNEFGEYNLYITIRVPISEISPIQNTNFPTTVYS